MRNRVSVVITTRNRSKELKHCIGSLVSQSRKIDELVVVDNNSNDDTKKIVENIASQVRFPVRYVLEKKVGYPYVYNRGLNEAAFEWIAFIDDDCIANPNWYKRIIFIAENIKAADVILGKSSEYNTHSIMALTKDYIDDIGKIGAIRKKVVIDFEVLDSKNIVYKKSFLKKNNISFDINLLKYGQGASEDCDIGMQIMMHKGIAIYDEKVHVYHKDPVDFVNYYKKTNFTLVNHLVYEKKWRNVRENIQISRSLKRKLSLFEQFTKKYSLSLRVKILVFLNIVLTFLFIKTMRLFYSKYINSLKIPYAK